MNYPMTPSGFAFTPESPVCGFRPDQKVRVKEARLSPLDWPYAGREGILRGYSIPRGYAIVDFGDCEHLIHPESLA